MQVKKFEARSMKEALEMVKRQLGPDAIILSARDHGNRFGLVGDGSVEITAAVSEETLQKKRFAESRMKPEIKEKFLSSPARKQRQIMDNFVESYQRSSPQPSSSGGRPAGNFRYADIHDEGVEVEANVAQTRIKDAASKAWDALRSGEGMELIRSAPVPTPTAKAPSSAQTVAPIHSAPTQSQLPAQYPADYLAMKAELEGLKKIFTEFKQMPQNFSGAHPGSQYGFPYDFSACFEKLVQAGMKEDLVVELLTEAQDNLPIQKQKSRGLIEGWVAKRILDNTDVTGDKLKSRIQCFFGPRGSGKSSSLIKMASQAVIEKHKSIAILTTDTMKVGAIDQMRIYSQILNVPFGIVKRSQDWSYFLEQLADVDMIFCDFPGLSLRDSEELSLLKSLLPMNTQIESHLVLSAVAKNSDIEEACRRYDQVNFDSLIFNHLDEASNHGTIYNSMRHFEKPLHSFGVGPRLPEDVEMATKERVLDLIFKLTKLKRTQE